MGPLGMLAIGAGTQLFGSALGYAGQNQANKTNVRLAADQRAHDVEMWNKQNAYNTPSMQMQRLKEAGLNPNLIYGSGSASAGNAQSPPNAPRAEVSNTMTSFSNNSLIPLLSQYNDWQVKKAQIENINQETLSKKYANAYQELLQPNYEIMARAESNRKYHDADYANTRNMLSFQNWQEKVDQYKVNKKNNVFENRSLLENNRLNESQQRIHYLRESTKQKMLQNQLDEQLKPLGVTSSDELWQRILAKLAGKFLKY